MLRNPSNTTLVENEYEKLKFAWAQQLNCTEKQNQEPNHEQVQFTLINLFHGYLNQIWIDSQNMLQCAQSWNTSDGNQKDAAFTMNILGLHLMKQSLRTRQELLHIVDEASSTFDCFSMPPAKPLRASFACCSSSSSSTYSLVQKHRPIRLTSSPSTPTINNKRKSGYWQDDMTMTCKHAFAPGSNYSLYFPEESNDKVHNLSCHFCHETLGLKKSFSVDNFCSMPKHMSSICSSSSYDDENEEHHAVFTYYGCSKNSFEVTSLEDDMLASKKLLVQDQDKDDRDFTYQEKLSKYQLIADLHGSSKVEIGDDNASASISSSGTTAEEPNMMRSTVSNNLLHKRMSSSSNCLPESIYSSDNCHCRQNTMPRKKRNLSMFFSANTAKTSFKEKLKQYREDKDTMPRSLSTTLYQIFSSSSSRNNKRQKAQDA